MRRNTSSPLTQKIKAPRPPPPSVKTKKDEFDNEWSDRFQLPSLPRQKSCKDNDDISSSGNSATTSVSWSQEAKNTMTQKLERLWTMVEKTFNEEEDAALLQPSVLDECIQWRTQIPYLRIIGRNPAYTADSNDVEQDSGSNNERMKRSTTTQNDKIFVEHNPLIKEEEDFTDYNVTKAKFQRVLDILTEYVIARVIPNQENETDSLGQSLSTALKIAPAPLLYGTTTSSSRNSKTNWTEEAISPNYIENKSLSIRNRLLDTESSLWTKRRNSISANKSRHLDNMQDDDTSKESLHTAHIGRNKLGTIFNERIVVSPVPFAVSTRESFSTLNTIPIRFMNEDLEISPFRASARYVSGGFPDSVNRLSALRNSNIHSAWQTPPVCPTIWPKNIRLAPIDASSRLPSSKSNKNRFVAPSPAILRCNRKSPLSPIDKLPKSAHAGRVDRLEIRGKHIIPLQSKISLLSAGWDYSCRTTKSKKKKT